jgi:UDP-glucose 4-epimerase
VVAFGRAFSPDFESKVGGRVEVRVVDFNETLSTHAALQGIDQVINLVNASSPALGNGRVEEDLLNNALPHVAFTQSCLLSGVSRMIFVSSGGTVYGEPRYLPVDEDHITAPLVSYGMTKLVAEQYIRMLTRGTAMSYIILRVSNPFGPGQMLRKGQGLIASVLERHAQSAPISIYGDGQTQRDYLYIDDLCEALIAALDVPSMQETFNIGTGVGRSVMDILTAIEAHIGQQLAKEFLPARHTDAKSNVLDCRKAERMLGWTARTPFDEAIRRTVVDRD